MGHLTFWLEIQLQTATVPCRTPSSGRPGEQLMRNIGG